MTTNKPTEQEAPELILLPQVTAMLARESYHYCADCKAHCRQLIFTVEALKELNRAYTARVDPPAAPTEVTSKSVVKRLAAQGAPAAPDERDHAAIHQRMSEEEIARWEQDRAAVEQFVERWYYEVATPRFENDNELADLQSRILKYVATVRKEGAQQTWMTIGAELRRYGANIRKVDLLARFQELFREVESASKQER